MRVKFAYVSIMILGLFTAVAMAASHGPAGDVDLAIGHPVVFSPAPNYSLTKRGRTDATDLTNGKTTQRSDQHIWFEKSSVGWSYLGRCSLAVDLGHVSRINEVAIRFSGGSPQPKIEVPGWVEVFVSMDGKHYRKVGTYWRWRKGEAKKFGLPASKGRAWVYALPFKHLNVTGRYVGIRFDGWATSDELYVWGNRITVESSKQETAGEPSGFTVRQPQFYFNKPYLELATNIALPVPVGMATPESKVVHEPYYITLDLPKGIELAEGQIHHVGMDKAKHTSLPNGKNRYRWILKEEKTSKIFGQLYLQATKWHDGQQGIIHYQFGNADWQSPILSIPVRAVKLSKAPRLTGIMTGMGWWSASTSLHWPEILKAYRVLGLNTFNVFSMWMPKNHNAPEWRLLAKARQKGFYISDIDKPFYSFIQRKYGKLPKDVYFQFKNGSIGKLYCPCYRGQYFREEVKLFGQGIASVKPDFVSLDIEPWGYRGPVARSKKCVRCIANFKKSGLHSWQEWSEMMGRQIWGSLVRSARKASKAAGGSPFKIGAYDFRPHFSFKKNDAYQNVFSFHQLYPKLLNMSQPSVYMSFQPYAIAHLGNVVHAQRVRMLRNDIMPWVTPGDTGVFPGKAFKWGLLACYLNGSRGIWFWSSRSWDSEDLIAYHNVIQAIAPIQKLILQGRLVSDAVQVIGPGRARGLELSGDMALLVSDFTHQTNGTVKLKLNLSTACVVTDLLNHNTIATHLPVGVQTFDVNLQGQSARMLQLRSVSR